MGALWMPGRDAAAWVKKNPLRQNLPAFEKYKGRLRKMPMDPSRVSFLESNAPRQQAAKYENRGHVQRPHGTHNRLHLIEAEQSAATGARTPTISTRKRDMK